MGSGRTPATPLTLGAPMVGSIAERIGQLPPADLVYQGAGNSQGTVGATATPASGTRSTQPSVSFDLGRGAATARALAGSRRARSRVMTSTMPGPTDRAGATTAPRDVATPQGAGTPTARAGGNVGPLTNVQVSVSDLLQVFYQLGIANSASLINLSVPLPGAPSTGPSAAANVRPLPTALTQGAATAQPGIPPVVPAGTAATAAPAVVPAGPTTAAGPSTGPTFGAGPSTGPSTAAGPSAGPPTSQTSQVKASIKPPSLDISGATDAPTAAKLTKAFVKRVEDYWRAVADGHEEHVRRLYLDSALSGEAQKWWLDWTEAKGTYTSTEALDALQARFATKGHRAEDEARYRLHREKHRMKADESVQAYFSRFEALFSSLPNESEEAKVFYFRVGLSDKLRTACASGLDGRPIDKYADLVQYALGQQAKFLASNSFGVGPRLAHAHMQDTDDSEGFPEDSPVPGKQKRSALRAAAAYAKSQKTVRSQQPKSAAGGRYQPEKGGVPVVADNPVRCFCCDGLGHIARNCTADLKRVKRKAKRLDKGVPKKTKEDE